MNKISINHHNRTLFLLAAFLFLSFDIFPIGLRITLVYGQFKINFFGHEPENETYTSEKSNLSS
jgi:hypothetical protein